MQATFRCDGSTVFVFGGTSGINLGIAEAFAEAGATVAVASRSAGKVEAAVARLTDAGKRSGHDRPASGYALDVRDAAAVGTALDAFASAAGGIDVVVSGAAGNFLASAATLSPNGFKAVVDIDLLGSFHVARAAYAHLRKPGGCLIHISAPQASIAMPMQAHVCAAKAGVDMLTRTLALEWGPVGIRVNSVSPGPIDDTEGMRRLAPDEASRDRCVRSVPMRRMGDVRDIANACLFVASDAASYVSGTVIPVDGGWAAAGANVGS
ncbi:MAG TPA: SDR family oxidoreductase [Steroidobacteraceae bacterium]|nr:SDR family oxidoreductase [Steroidobacteraceae bacterium]